MTVGELIELLQDEDPDAQVFIMSQPHWPFEYSIHGVTTRRDFTPDEYEEGEDEDVELPRGVALEDVFILEGDQERYGSKYAWEHGRS